MLGVMTRTRFRNALWWGAGGAVARHGVSMSGKMKRKEYVYIYISGRVRSRGRQVGSSSERGRDQRFGGGFCGEFGPKSLRLITPERVLVFQPI